MIQSNLQSSFLLSCNRFKGHMCRFFGHNIIFGQIWSQKSPGEPRVDKVKIQKLIWRVPKGLYCRPKVFNSDKTSIQMEKIQNILKKRDFGPFFIHFL